MIEGKKQRHSGKKRAQSKEREIAMAKGERKRDGRGERDSIEEKERQQRGESNGRGERTMVEGKKPWRQKKNLKKQWQMGVKFSTRKEKKPQPKERKSVMVKERERNGRWERAMVKSNGRGETCSTKGKEQ